jgi:hypothetical protein
MLRAGYQVRELFMANGWGGARPGAGRKPGSKVVRRVPLTPAQAHRVTVEKMPLDILVETMRDPAVPLELRLVAAVRAAPYYHAKVSTVPPKASFEMTDLELETAIRREKEHGLLQHPGKTRLVVINADAAE